MSVTREQVLAAGYHAEFHYDTCRKSVGVRGGVTYKIEVWRKNGMCKVWARHSTRWQLPVKYGFSRTQQFTYITNDNAHMWHRAEDCVPVVIDASVPQHTTQCANTYDVVAEAISIATQREWLWNAMQDSGFSLEELQRMSAYKSAIFAGYYTDNS